MLDGLKGALSRFLLALRDGLRAFAERVEAGEFPTGIEPPAPGLPPDWPERFARAVRAIEASFSTLDEAAMDAEKLAEAVADAIASQIRRAKDRAAWDAPPRLTVAGASPGVRTHSPAAMRRHTAVTGL